MNQPIDITLSTIHVGNRRRVVTLGINGRNLAQRFLEKLSHDDSRKMDFLTARIKSVSDYETYENDRTFNHLGEGLYEFKRPGIRLYAFYHEIEGVDHLIICTNGGTKNKKKEQNSDIAKANRIKYKYFAAIEKADTTLTLEEPAP